MMCILTGSMNSETRYAGLKIPFGTSEESLKRSRILKEGPLSKGPVVYWMSRNQRINDNWGLLFAQAKAIELSAPLYVVFCLAPRFLDAAMRQYEFMIRGLEDLFIKFRNLSIGFILKIGEPSEEIPKVAKSLNTSFLVIDFDPLKIKRKWIDIIISQTDLSIYEVDARNIIPCWIASPKLEFAAHTFRPKVIRALPEYVVEPPGLGPHPFPPEFVSIEWKQGLESLRVDRDVGVLPGVPSGEKAAAEILHDFCTGDLARYSKERNDPNSGAPSGLSPYLHFGQISSLRVAIEVIRSEVSDEAKEDFLEELITRRELADNFCYYNDHYDSWEGFHPWARKTLDEHREDEREYLYVFETLEAGQTHDDLWNAAQHQMTAIGTMPGYLRMYWAKKILEWSPSPEDALEKAIYLNDKYLLDGRDPNGYAGIAWSIGGVHDRAWGRRPIFGKIRYMSYRGCASKFDVKGYIRKVRDTITGL